MPRTPKGSLPSYRLHKSSGQAVVTLTDPSRRRFDVLLGQFGSEASYAEYRRVLAEWEANNRRLPDPTNAGSPPLTIAELILRGWNEFITQHYRDMDGNPTKEQENFKQSLKPLRMLYDHTIAAEFGPLALKAVRNAMIEKGWCRGWVNQSVGRIKHLFRWAVSEELIPAYVLHALEAVSGLSQGRTNARESNPVEPVPDDDVQKTLPALNRHVAGMVRLQRLTGMRPGEVCRMRNCDIDKTGEIWIYRPKKHKTAHRGKKRMIALGPKAQEIVKTFMPDDPEAFLFSPQRLMQEINAHRAANRKTKYYGSSQKGQKRKTNPKKKPGERYSVMAYGFAIRRACAKARITPWHPNQIRHTYATVVRHQFGLEAAQVGLGHSRADVTQVYAERDLSLAERIAAEIG